MKRLALIVFVLCAPAFGATDWYFASASAGANNGTSCANAFAYNDGTNGINVAAKQGADVTDHVCGTITLSANTNFFTAAASGTSGHLAILKFETGAIVQAPYFPGNTGGAITAAAVGAIVINAFNFWTVDGGVNGIVQATANGTGLANQQPSVGVYLKNCATCTVQNLTIANMYVHNLATDESGVDSEGIIIYGTGSMSTVTVSGNTIHDACFPINIAFGGASGINGLEVKNNIISNFNEGTRAGDTANGSKLLNFTWHDNQVHDAVLWDDNADNFHHNHIHIFAANGASSDITAPQIYNNFLYGDLGIHETSSIYVEPTGGTVTSPKCFNNVIRNDAGLNSSHTAALGMMNCQGSNAVIVNNTMLNNSTNGTNVNGCADFGSVSSNIRFQNNICDSFNNGLAAANTSIVYTAVSNNDYHTIGQQATLFNSPFTAYNMTGWQTLSGGDATPPTITTAPNLSASTFIPNSGSPVIGAGVNLTSLGIAALNLDKNGVARGSSWAIGALQPVIPQASAPAAVLLVKNISGELRIN